MAFGLPHGAVTSLSRFPLHFYRSTGCGRKQQLSWMLNSSYPLTSGISLSRPPAHFLQMYRLRRRLRPAGDSSPLPPAVPPRLSLQGPHHLRARVSDLTALYPLPALLSSLFLSRRACFHERAEEGNSLCLIKNWSLLLC